MEQPTVSTLLPTAIVRVDSLPQVLPVLPQALQSCLEMVLLWCLWGLGGPFLSLFFRIWRCRRAAGIEAKPIYTLCHHGMCTV